MDTQYGWKKAVHWAVRLLTTFGLVGLFLGLTLQAFGKSQPQEQALKREVTSKVAGKPESASWLVGQKAPKVVPWQQDEIKAIYEHVGLSGDGTTLVGLSNDYVRIYAKTSAGWGESAKISNSRRPKDVAISNDGTMVVVGLPSETYTSTTYGEVYLYTKVGANWTQVATLTAAEGSLGDAVAVSGDGATVIAGAPGGSTNSSNTTQGTVYLYTKPAGGWANGIQAVKLTAANGAAGERLGTALAINSDGTTVVAGVNRGIDNYLYPTRGAVYLYTKPVSGWADSTQTAKLTASDGAASDNLGTALAVSGDGTTVFAGAPGKTRTVYTTVTTYQTQPRYCVTPAVVGTRYVDNDPGPGQYPVQYDAVPAVSVACGTETVPVNNTSSVVSSYAGAVYLYTKPASGWVNGTQTAQLVASNGQKNSRLGEAIAVSNDGISLVVGAPSSLKSGSGAAAIYAYTKPTGGWVDGTETLKHTDTTDRLWYSDSSMLIGSGVAVSNDGKTIAVASHSAPSYLFTPPPPDPTIMVNQLSTITGQTVPITNGYQFDIGLISLGNNRTAQFKVKSKGLADLSIKNVAVVGRNAAEFLLDTSSFTRTLAGGEGTSFTVMFTPSSVGVVTATLIIESNDPAQPQYTITLKGVGFEQIVGPWAQQAKLPIRGVSYLGNVALSRDGKTMAVGLPHEGAVSVYTKVGLNWTQVATLTVTRLWDVARGGVAMSDVAMSSDGKTIVATSQIPSILARVESYLVYVFTKPAMGWATTSIPTARLATSDGSTAAWKAITVSGDGATVAVGRLIGDADIVQVYLYTRPAKGWVNSTETAKLSGSISGFYSYGRVSWAIKLSDDGTTVVSSWVDTDCAQYDCTPALYVYTKPAGGWVTTETETAKLTLSDAKGCYGRDIAVGSDGATIVASSPYNALYVYTKPAGGWVSGPETAKLTNINELYSDDLGSSLALSKDGSTLIAGADSFNDRQGAAYVYTKPTGGWATTNTFDARLTTTAGNGFGAQVAVSSDGKTMAVGSGGTENAVHLFSFSDSALNLKQETTNLANGGTSSFGTVNLGSSRVLTFTLENKGTTDLRLDDVALEGDDTASFMLNTSKLNPNLAPWQSTQFMVSFTPLKKGLLTASVTVASNDAKQPSTTILLEGTGFEQVITPTTQLPQTTTTAMSQTVTAGVPQTATAGVAQTATAVVQKIIEEQRATLAPLQTTVAQNATLAAQTATAAVTQTAVAQSATMAALQTTVAQNATALAMATLEILQTAVAQQTIAVQTATVAAQQTATREIYLELSATPLWTPTLTPTLTPTVTPTPSPFPTLTAPCPCPLKWLAYGSCYSSLSTTLTQSPTLDLNTFYQVRDLLKKGAMGQKYIAFYEQHGPEITNLLITDPALRTKALQTLALWQPALQALTTGKGASFLVTADLTQALDSFLQALAAKGSPPLQQAVKNELLAPHPLAQLVGKTIAQAQQLVAPVGWPVYLPLLQR